MCEFDPWFKNNEYMVLANKSNKTHIHFQFIKILIKPKVILSLNAKHLAIFNQQDCLAR